jgi:predicted phage baseplate assembly protein
VRNPLPATGGTAPEPIERVRLNAPQAFRTQERAVTDADYVAASQRHREVQRAAATRRWTGSWHTWFVSTDRTGGVPVNAEFEERMREFLDRFRLAGYDLEIDGPRFVPLDIALTVCVAPGYIRGDVRRVLLEMFGATDLPDGRRGFFHPDGLTFGQPIFLSQIVAAAMRTPGVAWVQPTRFQRWREDPHGELDDGRIIFGRLEIPRLDNDPNLPENGKIELTMTGGL